MPRTGKYFPRRARYPDGYLNSCRVCWREYYRVYYAKNQALVNKLIKAFAKGHAV